MCIRDRSGGDSVYRLSAIPSVSFRSNSFNICRPSPMLVQKMSIPGYSVSDSSFLLGVYSPDYDNCSNAQLSRNSLDVWERVTLLRFEPLTPSPWLLIRWRLSAIPIVSFKSNSFTICRPSPMLVQKMSIPGHGDSDSSVREYPHQLGCQMLHYKTLPWISPYLTISHLEN